MSEEFLRWLLGGLAAAAVGVATRLWLKMWAKDAEIDKVREEKDAVIASKDARIEALVKSNYELQIGFEKTHGATIRKALDLVMAAKHHRPPREPKKDRDAVSQLNRLTQELSGEEVEDILRSVRGE